MMHSSPQSNPLGKTSWSGDDSGNRAFWKFRGMEITAVLPVLASTLKREMLSGRSPMRFAPASPPITRMLYRPSMGSNAGPEANTFWMVPRPVFST